MERGRAEFVSTPKPQLKPGHALVRTGLISLCGSDVHLLYHSEPELYPFAVGTTGHEMVGVVEEVDAAESDLRPGDVVLALAPTHEAMTELFLVPIDDVIVLPRGAPLEHLLMAQQLGTVIYACKHLPNLVGKTAAVVGQGSAGLYFDSMLRRMGCECVIGLDVKAARVEAGRRFGATHTVNAELGNGLEAVSEFTGGLLADVVVEAAGEVSAINIAASLVKGGGHVVFFGVPRVHRFEFDYFSFYRKYCTTRSISGATSEPGRLSFGMAVKLIHEGQIDVSSMLTHRFNFDEVMRAYELAYTRDDGVIKAIIEMPGYACLLYDPG